jgi:hypothetical protein
MIVQRDRSIVRYVARCMFPYCELIPHRSQTEWSVVFAVLRRTITHTEAASLAFQFLSDLVQNQDELMTTDNYAGTIMLLDDFASLGGVVTETAMSATS